MQRNGSWGGVFRFPLNLCRIAGHLMATGCNVHFVDLQADPQADLLRSLQDLHPDLCILSCGYPSMRQDAHTAQVIKQHLPTTHVSTFGVAPTALKDSFFDPSTWGFPMPFDSIVVGGEPALGYERLITEGLELNTSLVCPSEMEKQKSIRTRLGRSLFDARLYRSPFTGDIQTYVEGSYGCPKRCTFCVVNQLYAGAFAKRGPEEIVDEIIAVIENDGVQQISLWDEGTTFQRPQIQGICELLIKAKEKSKNSAVRNFTWNTRSTTALLDEETVQLMKRSGVTGITVGLESFDETVLAATHKGTTVADNDEAIRLLKNAGIISIGHIPLGFVEETRESAELTVRRAIESELDIAQFYCAVPYPGTELHTQAVAADLIRVTDLTQYELCNPIMDTAGGLTHTEVGQLRKNAMQRFYEKKKLNLRMLNSRQFSEWSVG